MAHFFASIQGSRGEATRLGGKSSWISGHVRGWNVGVEVKGRIAGNGEDVFEIYATSGSSNEKKQKLLGVVHAEKGVLTFEPETEK